MTGEELIKVWLIIPVAAYERLQTKGCLGGDGRRICWKGFRRPYIWMSEQMRDRLGPSPTGSDYPVWVWYQWDRQHPKPDLRSSGHLSPGQRGYRLELLMPKATVLLSDFEAWHCVLNNWYCWDDPGHEQWEADLKNAGLTAYNGVDPILPHCVPTHEECVPPSAGCPASTDLNNSSGWDYNFLPAEFDQRRRASWQKIFEITDPENKEIQGTTWKIERSQVIEATPFVAR